MAESQDAIGSVAEEAMKLIFALSTNAEDKEHVCSNSWCPLCQLVNHVRDNPEALERVTQSAANLARSVRDLFDNVAPSDDAAPTKTAPTKTAPTKDVP